VWLAQPGWPFSFELVTLQAAHWDKLLSPDGIDITPISKPGLSNDLWLILIPSLSYYHIFLIDVGTTLTVICTYERVI